ncbi:MAG: hypothetical protein JKY32_15575 [Rhizobiales bacterium]|nr:hypothetical protein [Hyphomicrobiales bacterium]
MLLGFQKLSIHLIQAISKKRALGFVAVLCLLLTSGIASADPVRATDPRLDDFLKMFDAQLGTDDVHRLRPWQNFLAIRFEQGLPEKFQVKYLAHLLDGNCDVVAEIDQYGFTQLYPFLEPAFNRIDIKNAFLNLVVPEYSDGYGRCRALYQLTQLEERLAFEELQRVDSSYFRNVGGHWRYTDSDNSLILPLRRLVDLAVCRDYGSAILDLKHLYEADRLLEPDPTLQYYLSERVMHMGLEANSVAARRTMRLQVPVQFRAIVDVSAYGPNWRRIDSLFPGFCPRDYRMAE